MCDGAPFAFVSFLVIELSVLERTRAQARMGGWTCPCTRQLARGLTLPRGEAHRRAFSLVVVWLATGREASRWGRVVGTGLVCDECAGFDAIGWVIGYPGGAQLRSHAD